MADPLLELLEKNQSEGQTRDLEFSSQPGLEKYLSRLLSLRPGDLTSTEPQSLAQSSHTNLLSLQALSSRSHRSTIESSDQLVTLQEAIPTLSTTIQNLQQTIPQLDASAVSFASTYSKSRTVNTTIATSSTSNTFTAIDDPTANPLTTRKDVMLLTRQSTKLQDILDLPTLLSTAIASAASTPAGSANYTQALDLYAHIKRLQILYPDSRLVADVQGKAEAAMKDMTVSLLGGLRGQNIRLAAAIRMVGWLRRVVPEIGEVGVCVAGAGAEKDGSSGRMGGGGATTGTYTHHLPGQDEQDEGSFGAIFLVARLSIFLSMTEDALAPLRDLADQETEKRLLQQREDRAAQPAKPEPQPVRRASAHGPTYGVQGQQTERYLKRYIEIFREQSFATVQMYRNIFAGSASSSRKDGGIGEDEGVDGDEDIMRLPSALASFPMHLVSLLIETLQDYLPNVTDGAARESLLIQVLYAANSLGRLGADFSMLTSLLQGPASLSDTSHGSESKKEGEDEKEVQTVVEPEWYRAIRKHRIQAARLDALASGQEDAARRASQDVTVR